jgi:transcriptional regulator with XRE-family HTH domain
MNLSEIEERLLDNLRARVKRREISERRLALHTGFSQPHIHNVLKGARQLTAGVADRIMERMGITLEDLFQVSELERALPHREFKDSPFREVPMLKGRIAAGQPFPVDVRYSGTRAFTAEFLKQFVRPVLLKVGAGEMSMLPSIQPNDLLLIDQNEEKRRQPVFSRVYALSLEEGGTLKHCEVVNGELVIVPENMQQRGFAPRTVSLEERNILDVVRGVVVWIGREM